MPAGADYRVLLNPLRFFQAEGFTDNSPPSPEDALSYLCATDIGSDVGSLVTRYQRISGSFSKLWVAPAEENILTKLVYPLKHAASSYLLGNYIGTISLCGMVAEMTSILIFKMSNFRINGTPLDRKAQVALFGSRFERLGQEKRVEALFNHNLIDNMLKNHFDNIRQLRRQYLHFFSTAYTKISADAEKVLESAVAIIVTVIGQKTQNNTILLNPDLIKYLDEKGV